MIQIKKINDGALHIEKMQLSIPDIYTTEPTSLYGVIVSGKELELSPSLPPRKNQQTTFSDNFF